LNFTKTIDEPFADSHLTR